MKRKRRVRCSRTGTRLFRLLLVLLLVGVAPSFVSCKTAGKISIKQNCQDNVQEVELSTDSELNNL